jgi:spore maturation protein CgeB
MEVIRDGENGFIAKNEYDYIEKIDYIFNHESINQIAINAFDTVYERFDNRKIVLNNIDYYTSLL